MKARLFIPLMIIMGLVLLVLVACTSLPGDETLATAGSLPTLSDSTPAIQQTPTPDMEPVSSPTLQSTGTATVEVQGPAEQGSITIAPSTALDGAWIALTPQQTVTIQWLGGPIIQTGRVEFYLAPTGTGTYDARQLIGADALPADGASVSWQVVPGGFTGHLWAEGFDDQNNLVAFSPTLQVIADESLVPTAGAGSAQTPSQTGQVITAQNAGRLAVLGGLPLPADITWIAWSGDNRTLAAATTNGVALFDAVSQEQTGVLLLGVPIHRLLFSPDGRYLLLFPAEFLDPPTLWDVQADAKADLFSGKWSGVMAAAFSPDGSRLVTGTQKGILSLWDLATGELDSEIDIADLGADASAGQPRINYLTYLPDGRAIVAETASGWTEWLLLDSIDGHLIGKISPEGHIAGPVASPLFAPGDGQHVYWLSRASIIKVDLATDEEEGAYHHTDFVLGTAFSPDGLLLATIASQTVDNEMVPAITLWDLSQGQPARTLTDLVNMPSAVAFSPDGTRLAYATNGEGITILGVR
jgi:WD40 repeat protein